MKMDLNSKFINDNDTVIIEDIVKTMGFGLVLVKYQQNCYPHDLDGVWFRKSIKITLWLENNMGNILFINFSSV